MPPSTSTRESIYVLRERNEAKILKFLKAEVGPAPAGSLCPKHTLRTKKLCTSKFDRSLRNAGRWYSYCKPCNRIYFSALTVDVQGLIENNSEFRALIETRRVLKPGARPRFIPKPGARPRFIPRSCN